MLALVVHVDSGNPSEARTRAFVESPVRIGRSPFANLRLREPFVSEWHAVVRFHTPRTTYLDLGSKNCSYINGRAMERNVEVEITDTTEIRIGTLRLRFTRSEQPIADSDPASDQQSAFEPRQFSEPERPTGTQVLPGPASAAQRSAQPNAARPNLLQPMLVRPGFAPAGTLRVVPPQPPIRPPPAPPSVKPALRAAAGDPLMAAHLQYRRAAGEFLQLVCTHIEEAPADAQKERVLALRRGFPELMHEAAFRAAAERAGVYGFQLGHLDVQDWLKRLCGVPSTAPPEQLALTMERVGQLLELFATAFIESRRAHQRAQQRLALDTTNLPTSPLQQSEDPHALLAYLLNPEADVRSRSQELRSTLADFAMHQIALLSAVVEGARTLLEQLGPDALREYREPRHAVAALDKNPSAGGIWPFAARKLWRRFLVRHSDLMQTDHFTRALFGREFQRRYHAIADSSQQVQAARTPARKARGVAT